MARYHNVYGPNGTYDGGREKAPAAICRKVIQAKASGKHTIEIWGDGHQTRSFMFIDRLPQGHAGPCFGATSSSRSTSAAVSWSPSISSWTSSKTSPASSSNGRTTSKRPKGVNGRNSDNTLIKKLMGWEPDTKLRVGMEKTYRWIYDQMVSKRKSA